MVVNLTPYIGAGVLLGAALTRDAYLWNGAVMLNGCVGFIVALVNIQSGEPYILWNTVALACAVVAGLYYRRNHPKQRRHVWRCVVQYFRDDWNRKVHQ